MDPTKFTIRRSAISPANAIFIIDCLNERDLQTGRSRLQNLHDLLLSRDPEKFDDDKNFIHRFEANSASEFAECFEAIMTACTLGIRPILFIDAHGHPQLGLGMPSQELVSWNTLLELLEGIVEKTAGELTVIVAACHSMKAVESLRPNGRLPFSFYYGYPSNVMAGVVEAETELIYKSLFNDGGKSIMSTTHFELECWSEYDHVQDILATALLMAKAPSIVAEMIPQLSRANMRTAFDEVVAKTGTPQSGSRKKLNQLLNSGQHAIRLVEDMMHDTPRRDRVIQDIKSYIQETPLPPVPALKPSSTKF
ncbi:hypothetical protein QC590_16680 [Pseudomonas putida]|uniref:hypothetical protein n=1 Tax=Pseudomonas putida TaxID=303 RepID=UPI0033554FE9